MKTNYVIAVVAVLLVIGGVVFFVWNSANKESAQRDKITMALGAPIASTVNTPVASGSDSMMVDETVAREIVVEAKEMLFNPKEIRIKKGEKVKIVLKNTGKMVHDWVLEDTDYRTKIISPSESDTVEFVIDEAGEYTYFCSVGTHRQMGMEGKLIVE
jgi:plastocyanin